MVTCPFTGELLAAVPAIRPDVTVIHAQKADRKGNVLIWGIVGVQKEAVLAAKRSIVTVEEIVDQLDGHSNACFFRAGWSLQYVWSPRVPIRRMRRVITIGIINFYQSWDKISRSREEFSRWMELNVLSHSPGGEPRREATSETAEVT